MATVTKYTQGSLLPAVQLPFSGSERFYFLNANLFLSLYGTRKILNYSFIVLLSQLISGIISFNFVDNILIKLKSYHNQESVKIRIGHSVSNFEKKLLLLPF